MIDRAPGCGPAGGSPVRDEGHVCGTRAFSRTGTNELVGPPVTYPSPCTLPVFRADLVLVDTVHLGSSK
jgi:hypothetical protein